MPRLSAFSSAGLSPRPSQTAQSCGLAPTMRNSGFKPTGPAAPTAAGDSAAAPGSEPDAAAAPDEAAPDVEVPKMLRPTGKWTAHQFFYIFFVNGIVAFVVSGAINFAVAYGKRARRFPRK